MPESLTQSSPQPCNTALMAAVHENDLAAIEALLPQSDPLARNAQGETALSIAARRGLLEATRILLPWTRDAAVIESLSANADAPSPPIPLLGLREDCRALMTAIVSQSWELSAELAALLATPDAVRSRDARGRGPLLLALRNGVEKDAIAELARRCGDEGPAESGATALTFAAENSKPELVASLAAFCDPLRALPSGETALDLALSVPRMKVADALLAAMQPKAFALEWPKAQAFAQKQAPADQAGDAQARALFPRAGERAAALAESEALLLATQPGRDALAASGEGGASNSGAQSEPARKPPRL